MLPMISKTWQVMNSLQESFNNITTFDFILEELQQAVDAGDTQKIVDTTAALNAFYPVYTSNFDRKFKEAWDTVVKAPASENSDYGFNL
jgi:hypothetical protein